MENSYTKHIDNIEKKERLQLIQELIDSQSTVNISLYNHIYKCKIISISKDSNSVLVYYDYVKNYPFYTTVWINNVML